MATSPTTVAKTWLGRVKVVGGKAEAPYYLAELRAALRLQNVVTEQVVRETAGLRALMVSNVAESVKIDPTGSVPLHAPYLLRLHAAAYPDYDADRLSVGGKPGKVLPLPGRHYGDWLVTPASAQWPAQTDPNGAPGDPDTERDRTQASVPHFRVQGGDTELALLLEDSALCKLLGAKEKSLFGGLATVAVALPNHAKGIALALVAEGIEFSGSLPDPTRDYGGADGMEKARIAGRFRLEYDAARPNGGYLLRLVTEPGAAREPMDALEARIGAAFTDLALEGDSPLAISLDRRPVVPPLIWPLTLTRDVLALVPAAGAPGDFEMEIDRSAASVRLRTRSNYPGEAAALAAVLVDRIGWIKTAVGFDVRLAAGAPQGEALTLAFAKGAGAAWSTELAGTGGAQPVTVPLFEHAGRMLDLYRQARAKAAHDQHPAFLYFPVAGGWLQLGLPKENTTPAPDTPPADKPASVLSGNIVAGTGTGAGRSIRINDAQALVLTMHWEPGPGALRARRGQLAVSGAQAMFRGFLFAAETSPTAAEALPDLRRGPAATRELPVYLGAATPRLGLAGKFTWHAADDSWSLDVERVEGGNLDLADPVQHYAWLSAAPNPFISNHPLTRSVASATEPSLSRSLLPMRLGPVFSLRLDGGTALPRLLPKSPFTWDQVFLERGAGFRADTLLLPTLAGIEFVPPASGPAPGIEAALRFDVPLLDELFAWSDPPIEKDSKAPPAVVESVAVTSLDLEGMHKVWRANRARMALTRTPAAFASPWQPVGASATIAVSALVEPYSWITSFKVDIAATLYGSYSLGGVDYTPQRAVGGLDRVAFRLDGQELKQDSAGPIQIAGFAASLFDVANRRWDSRGFGMAPEATGSGRPVSLRTRGKNTLVEQEWILFTMAKVASFRRAKAATAGLGFPFDLHFYVRDLALANGTFDGATNPVESARGVTGQAFLPAAFPGALHEWRLFEEPQQQVPVRRHDIAYGPFRFKPLRLLHASFDADNAPLKIKIVGSMRLDLDPALAAQASTPFGPDEVYRGGDLFQLTLEHDPASGNWSHNWLALAARAGDDPGRLVFAKRDDDTVGCALVLAPSGAGIGARAPVAATLHLGLNSGGATLRARLFGNDAVLFCKAYQLAGDGIDLVFDAPSPAPHVPQAHGAWLIDVATSVEIRKTGSTLRIDGALVAMADGATAPTAAAALAVFRPEGWRWLDFNSDAAPKPPQPLLRVDHSTGVVSGSWSATGSGAPLFGLMHTDFSARGNMEAVAAMGPLSHNSTCIPMASAWMRVSCIAADAQAAVEHRLLAGSGQGAAPEHVLDISATVVVNSAIAWPLGGITKSAEGDGKVPLNLTDDPWFEPGQAGAPLKPLSRVFSIAPDAPLARHQVTLRLKRHRIAAAQLVRHAVVTVRAPVRLLAVAAHRLIQAQTQGGNKERVAHWKSLDYLSITTAAAMLAATEIPAEPAKRWYYFAPRYRFGSFRNASENQLIKRASLAPMSRALSGFYDQSMVELLWRQLSKDHAHTPLFLGGSALQFRFGKLERSLLAVMPWCQLPGKELALEQRGGVWHAASADLWSAHALSNMESLRLMGLAADVEAPHVAQRFAAAGVTAPAPSLALADVLPVEQSFFEKWDLGTAKPLPMTASDLLTAPFFLRTLLVVARRWRQDDSMQPAPAIPLFGWDVASLHPCRSGADVGRGVGAIRVEIRADSQGQVPYREPVTMVPADLVVLSRAGARRIGAYRMVAKSSLIAAPRGALNAALVERALDEDRAALVAIQEADNDAGPPAIAVAPIPRRLDDWLARPASDIKLMPRIGPSGALGWPSPVALQGLERMGPRLGAELPVLSPEAGFAARFQRFGWPALAVRQGMPDDNGDGAPAPEAYYLSFANRVAYERDTALAFDGPPARHLMPAPVRRRAPLSSSLEGALLALAGSAGAAEPLLLPGIERATLGRRPGVFEVAVASLTIPADPGAFDPGHARFGRPANSAPVAAHQLRTPRSPLLPGDLDDEQVAQSTGLPVLAFRRRTYLSEADRDPAGHYLLFKTFDGQVDILRLEVGAGAEAKQARVALRILGGDLIGQNWNGKLSVAVSARKEGGAEGGNEVAGLELEHEARLEIGSQSFALGVMPNQELGAAFSWECPQVAQVRAALRAASVDTAIWLKFGVRPAAVGAGTGNTLPEAAVSLCALRLALDPGIRSVLPVSTTTIAFGDPSYDRQLASPTRFEAKEVEGARKVSKRIVLAADRKQYDVGSTLYLAFGVTHRATGLFAGADADFKPRLRITHSRPGDRDQQPIESALLAVKGVAAENKRYPLAQGTPYAVALSQLYSPEDASASAALRPGDQLTLSVLYNGKDELVLALEIVAQPVIAPAPCVFSVLGSAPAAKAMTVVLHAAGPLPQRIEFDDLKRDLALGLVLRRGLFIWRWAAVAGAGATVELVKFDRSGGAQLPPTAT